MSKIKVCDRCREKIRPKVQDYYQVDTYEKGRKIKEGYLHKKCNREIEEEKKKLKTTYAMIGQMFNKVNTLLELDGKKKPTIYDIK